MSSLVLALGLVLVAGCRPLPAPVSGASSGAPLNPPPTITAIQYERRCFGCPSESIVLRRDGSATHTILGNLRQGTADVTYAGVVAVTDFDALARLLVEERFFELSPEYTNPALADGRQVTITVTAGGREVRVRESNDAGPPALRKIVQAIERAMNDITWKRIG